MSGAPEGAQVWFLGVPFTPLPLVDAASRIAARAPGAPFAFVTTPNAHHVVAANRGDERFAGAQAEAWLVLNDSRILRLLARALFGWPFPLATGSDLAVELFENWIEPDDAITIIGGSDELETRLRRAFRLRRLHRLTPPMGFAAEPDEVARCAAFVRDNPARYVFIVVGAPQAETVARRIAELGGATGVGLCLGSALNFLTGVSRRAPGWVRAANLEWLHRLLCNPRGHARRVFVESPPILLIALRARLAGQLPSMLGDLQ